MPDLIIAQEPDLSWIVWNKTLGANFRLTFQTEEQAMQFAREFMFKFFTDRIN